MEVCFVGYVRDGMISRAYEYFDTGQIDKFIEPRDEDEPRELSPGRQGLVDRVARARAADRGEVVRGRGAAPPARRGDRGAEGDRRLPVVRAAELRRLRDRHADLRRHRPGRGRTPTRRWAGSPPSTWSTTGCSRCSPRSCRTRSSARSPTCWRPAASTRPGGRRRQPDGGYLLSGHWQFGTGICHADWVLLSGKVEGDEPPRAAQLPAPASTKSR